MKGPQEYIQIGNEFLKNNKYKKAIEAFNDALKIDVDNIKAYLGLAKVYHKKGDVHNEMATYQKVTELYPNSAAFAFFQLGNFYKDNNNVDQAISAFTKVIEIDPFNAEAYYKRGLIYNKECSITGSSRTLVLAAVDYAQALNLSKSTSKTTDSRYTRLHANIQMQESMEDILHKVTKIDLLNGIQKLSPRNQIRLLAPCLDKEKGPKDPVGRRFWMQEGPFSCDLKSGTLLQIKKQVDKMSELVAKQKIETVFFIDTLSTLFDLPKELSQAIKKKHGQAEKQEEENDKTFKK